MSVLQGLKNLALWVGEAATAVACTYTANMQSMLGKRQRVEAPTQQYHGGREQHSFKVGEKVEIYSESGGGWVAGVVISLTGNEPTVRYKVGDRLREKMVYEAGLSSQLRRKGSKPDRSEQDLGLLGAQPEDGGGQPSSKRRRIRQHADTPFSYGNGVASPLAVDVDEVKPPQLLQEEEATEDEEDVEGAKSEEAAGPAQVQENVGALSAQQMAAVAGYTGGSSPPEQSTPFLLGQRLSLQPLSTTAADTGRPKQPEWPQNGLFGNEDGPVDFPTKCTGNSPYKDGASVPTELIAPHAVAGLRPTAELRSPGHGSAFKPAGTPPPEQDAAEAEATATTSSGGFAPNGVPVHPMALRVQQTLRLFGQATSPKLSPPPQEWKQQTAQQVPQQVSQHKAQQTTVHRSPLDFIATDHRLSPLQARDDPAAALEVAAAAAALLAKPSTPVLRNKPNGLSPFAPRPSAIGSASNSASPSADEVGHLAYKQMLAKINDIAYAKRQAISQRKIDKMEKHIREVSKKSAVKAAEAREARRKFQETQQEAREEAERVPPPPPASWSPYLRATPTPAS
jgi:hypothetical protein